jgi:hypothetical protein
MVVLTGDQLNGQTTSWDPRSVLSLYLTPLIQRKIPYAIILGNHDSEAGPLTRDEQMHLIQNLPYSYSLVGPENITGSGNYYLELRSPFKDQTHLATLWFLDTGTHADKDLWKPWSRAGYGFVHKDQIEWFKAKYLAFKETLLPYRPDGGDDLGPQWKAVARRRTARPGPERLDGRDKMWEAGADQGQIPARPPSVMFMHIPVPEAFTAADRGRLPSVKGASGAVPAEGELVVGERHEVETFRGGQSQPGIFDALTALNRQHSAALAATSSPPALTGVRLLVHGHMHNNSDCRRINNVWICFGGGSSFAAYGRPAIARRARVILFENWAQSIRTYHRLDGLPRRTDEFVLPFAP